MAAGTYFEDIFAPLIARDVLESGQGRLPGQYGVYGKLISIQLGCPFTSIYQILILVKV